MDMKESEKYAGTTPTAGRLHPFVNPEHPASCAYRITLSPHEWTWTQEEVEAMAKQLVDMDCGESQEEEVIQLSDYDGVRILPETTEFAFQCCDCELIHDIEIKRDGRGIVLKFIRRD